MATADPAIRQLFRVQNFPYSAEEVIPLHYGVPVWSERHFELFGKALALLAEVNSRQVHANLVTDYQGAGSNPESLVRWIKQADGSYKYDFTNFDRYLEMIAKSMEKPNTLRLNCWYADGMGNAKGAVNQLSSVTVFDSVTGQLSRLKEPPRGTEERYRFWEPVIEEALKSLLYPGPDGPVATERFEMFREGFELCEAMLYVQQAITAKKLSADLEQRASRYLYPAKVREPVGERTLALRRGWFSARMLSSVEDVKLFDLADEVARNLEQKK